MLSGEFSVVIAMHWGVVNLDAWYRPFSKVRIIPRRYISYQYVRHGTALLKLNLVGLVRSDWQDVCESRTSKLAEEGRSGAGARGRTQMIVCLFVGRENTAAWLADGAHID